MRPSAFLRGLSVQIFFAFTLRLLSVFFVTSVVNFRINQVLWALRLMKTWRYAVSVGEEVGCRHHRVHRDHDSLFDEHGLLSEFSATGRQSLLPRSEYLRTPEQLEVVASHGGHRNFRSLHRDPVEQGDVQDVRPLLIHEEHAQLVLHAAHALRAGPVLHGVHVPLEEGVLRVEHGCREALGLEQAVILHAHVRGQGFARVRGRFVVQRLLPARR